MKESIFYILIVIIFYFNINMNDNRVKYDVCIEYQYEDEPNETHTLVYSDLVKFKKVSPDILPVYSTDSVYCNSLFMDRTIDYGENIVENKKIWVCYDVERKFKVKNITYDRKE